MKCFNVVVNCNTAGELREALFKAAYEVKADPRQFDEMEIDEDYSVNDNCYLNRSE